jgi:hypothetical protein
MFLTLSIASAILSFVCIIAMFVYRSWEIKTEQVFVREDSSKILDWNNLATFFTAYLDKDFSKYFRPQVYKKAIKYGKVTFYRLQFIARNSGLKERASDLAGMIRGKRRVSQNEASSPHLQKMLEEKRKNTPASGDQAPT